MKKGNLLASTALVSAALAMGATSAHAVALKIGGFAEFWAGWADNEDFKNAQNNFDLKTDAELHFTGEETLDNGIKVGVRFELEAGNGNDNGSGPGNPTAHDGFDETFGWVKTKWGQINIGNNDVASAYVGGPSVVGPVGLTKSDAGDWLIGISSPNNMDLDLGASDAQNVTYFTPRVAGFQGIFSYSPDDSDYDDSDFDQQQVSTSNTVHNIMSAAVKFNRKFGNVGVGLGAGYTTLEAGDSSTRADRGPDTAEGYGGGVKVDIGPARISANYGFENLTSRDDTWWAIALRYKINKMHTVSAGYSNGERERAGGGQANRENEWFQAGWRYSLGKGVAIEASIFRAETDYANTTTSDVDGWGVVGGLDLSF